MEKTSLSEQLMELMIEDEAWKNLSGIHDWNEAELEKYKDRIDWNEVSSSNLIEWTIPMLEKFKERINWNELSDIGNMDSFTPEVLERFKDKLDWRKLSGKVNLTIETIRKMADYLDWKSLINHRDLNEIFDMAFLKEFEDRIPATYLRDSALWYNLVAKKVALLNIELALERKE